MGLVGQLTDGSFGLPTYQDLSYKLHFSTSNGGEISIWGIGGLSSVAFEPDADTTTWKNTFDNNQYKTGSSIAAAGVNMKQKVGKHGYVNTSAGVTYDKFIVESNS